MKSSTRLSLTVVRLGAEIVEILTGKLPLVLGLWNIAIKIHCSKQTTFYDFVKITEILWIFLCFGSK